MKLPNIPLRLSMGIFTAFLVMMLSPREMIAGFWFLYPSIISIFYWPQWFKQMRKTREQKKFDARFRDLVDFSS